MFARWLPGGYSAPKEFVLAAGLALAFAAARRAGRGALDAPLAAIVAWACLSAWFSLDPPQSFYGDSLQPYYGVLELALYAGAYWLGTSMEEPLRAAGGSALVGACGLLGAIACLQSAGLFPGVVDGRTVSATGNPAFYGACAAMLFPLALSAATRSRLAAVAAVLGAVGLILCRTRGAWMAAAVGVACWLALSRRLKPRLWWALAAAGLAVAGIVAGRALGRSNSDVMRIELWRAAARALENRPVLGGGPDTFMLSLRRYKSERFLAAAGGIGQKTAASGIVEQSSAHNDIMQAAATMGIGGLAAYLWLLFALGAAILRGLASDDASRERLAAAGGALAAAFFAAKTNPVPPEACFAAAWLAGSVSCEDVSSADRRSRLLMLRVGSTAVCAAFATILWARFQSGYSATLGAGAHDRAIAAARHAAELTPALLPHELRLAEALVSAAEAEPSRKEALASQALAVGERAARRHPGNPQAHELYGTVAFFASNFKNHELLELAMREMTIASTLDPHHPYSAERRVQIAEVLGDKAAADRARADLRRALGADLLQSTGP